MGKFTALHEIQKLDPQRDHERIVYLSACFDFPFDTTRALEFALFRTFAVPSISAILDGTGEFRHRAQKRYDDTDILISELVEYGYRSDRGSRAIRRMNQLHGRFSIPNCDFLYVLSTFIFEPIRWNDRYGWRPMCEAERLSYFYFWREVGQRMHIQEIPADYDSFDRFNREFEQERFLFAETNQRVGSATREVFVSWFPRPFAPLVRSAVYAMLDEPLREAFGFPQPSRLMAWLIPNALRLRSRLIRWMPARRNPRLRTDMKRPNYPSGYQIETIGPVDAGNSGS